MFRNRKIDHRHSVQVDNAFRRKGFEVLEPGGLGERTRAMLKVEDGCVNFCTYCIIPYARGAIDPARCPDTAREFSEYEYEKDREGRVLGGYPDRNNHHIDAVRYALEPVWRRRGADYEA